MSTFRGLHKLADLHPIGIDCYSFRQIKFQDGVMRLRFTIRMLMIVTVVAATACGWYAMKRHHIKRRYQAISHLEELSGPVSWYDGGSEFEYVYGIELAGQFIDATLWKEISLLTEARTVSLNQTNVTDDDFKHLRRFWNIRHLSLFDTRVTSDGIDSLSRLTTLETLILSNTSIDDRAIGSLSQLKNLTTLNVRGTNISTLGIDRLQVALPNCRLFHDRNVGEPAAAPTYRASRFDNAD